MDSKETRRHAQKAGSTLVRGRHLGKEQTVGAPPGEGRRQAPLDAGHTESLIDMLQRGPRERLRRLARTPQ